MKKEATKKSYAKPVVNCIQVTPDRFLCDSGSTEGYNEEDGKGDWK